MDKAGKRLPEMDGKAIDRILSILRKYYKLWSI